ncbi:MAG: carboxynorspermidine decarboxylase [Clostridia bacterium]|nr:carboxynorspermidine decarboxylase [Clostridia bacterium]
MKAEEIKTPAYILDEPALIHNLEILKKVRENTGCRILLAQKAFSMFSVYPVMRNYLDGTTASGLYEAQLGYEEFGGETHVYAPAFTPDEIKKLCGICGHIIFNSQSQLEAYGDYARKHNVSIGLRINPEFSTQEGHEIYDPCAPFSRLGVPISNLTSEVMNSVDGLHFHTLCEQNSDALIKTFEAVEKKLSSALGSMKWLNLGGGHHITRADYDISALEELLIYIKDKYNLQVYLEPGEAAALNAGYLFTTVLDIVDNGMKILILDTSASCHMPDVLEMPYRPPLKDSGMPGEKKFTYRLASRTCLAGDIIGDYSFDREIKIGDRLCFQDMAIYSMVKNNTFNGMPLPSIGIMKSGGDCEIIKEFGYEDFKGRLS